MVFERGNRNSVLKAANTICSNKQIHVQKHLRGDVQPDFRFKILLLTAEISIALKATRIKLMGNAANFSKQPSSFTSFITTTLGSSSSRHVPLYFGSVSETNFHQRQAGD